MNIWGITDKGKVRFQNQDSFYHWTNGNMCCAVVCDGMGGARAGNVASILAAQAFAENVSKSDILPEKRLENAVKNANTVVYEHSKADTNCWGMGTTLVGILANEYEAYIINVGDSRCYHLSDGELWQVTTDHSYVEELVAMGSITKEEARNHPNKNIITRALGIDKDVQSDIFTENLQPSDWLLLCSDGLTNEVTDEEILQILKSGTPQQCCDELLKLAYNRGAHDNVTIVIVCN